MEQRMNNPTFPNLTEVEAKQLEDGVACVEIKPNKDGVLALYVNGNCVFTSNPKFPTYTSCAEALTTYMNSY